MIVLGIVGTPAGGKSTVANQLTELGAAWINADLIARSMLERQGIRDQLVERFGQNIIGEDGKIDRSLLAASVFGDDDAKRAALRYLESVLHPPTRVEITARLRQAALDQFSVAVLDVPLLFESHWDVCCDEIWSIDAPRAQRLDRARRRGWDEDELARRESNQLTISEKNRLSNYLLMNDSSLGDLNAKVIDCWNRLIGLSADKRSNFSDQHCITDWAIGNLG